jgi:hypothetical protein
METTMKLNELSKKQRNCGKGSEFQKGTENNSSGLDSAAAKHPGNTIITPAKQKPPKFTSD